MNTTELSFGVRTPRLAVSGAILAILFCVLLFDNVFKLVPLGINAPLCVAAFYLLLCFTLGKQFTAKIRRFPLHLIFSALLSVTFVLYNNMILLTISAILIILLLGEQIMLCTDHALYSPDSPAFIGDSLTLWFGFSFGGVKGALAQYKDDGNGKKRPAGIVLGIVAAALILLIVLPLLLSADEAFAQILSHLFGTIDWLNLMGRIFAGISIFLLASGLFWRLGVKPCPKPQPAAPKNPRALSGAVVLIPLCALAVVLISFCAVQFLYLFSGNVPDGLTYSAYARAGFWQLLAATVIVMLFILLIQKFTTLKTAALRNARRILIAILLVCTIVLLISSFLRMVLYEQNFGFSELRLFTQFFMAALLILLIVSILRLWVAKINLKKCALFGFLACYTVLAFWNVDGFIAKQNIQNQGQSADVSYLTHLSVDALPYYIDLLDPSDYDTAVESSEGIHYTPAVFLGGDTMLVFKDYQSMREAQRLARMLYSLEQSDDWRYYNLGRSEARNLLEEHEALTKNIGKIEATFMGAQTR